MNTPGEQAQTVAVGDRDGKVVLQFHRPAQWIDLDPATAVEVAKTMLDAASNCGLAITIQAPPKKVTELQRQALHARCLMLLRNKRTSSERDEVLAVRITDALLNMLEL